jgi:threonylcarbamoyladenosine tRNA methylthiotransferase MtaB
MPQLGPALAKERGARLRAKGDAARAARFQHMIGSTQAVLVEKPGFGHSACFAPVSFDGGAFDGPALPGSIVSVAIEETDGARLIGRQRESVAA